MVANETYNASTIDEIDRRFETPVLRAAGVGPAGNLVEPAVNRIKFIQRGRAFRDPEHIRVVDWPANWRIPAPGDRVNVDVGLGSFVEYVEWDLTESIVKVYLR